ncbi:arsenate reductase (glutaredoxin) [Winogradskyella sp. PC-19]|uniref:arsenate reductase (glutaredoxin) n=1 Tax=unclassified Winogradskyella TaxID=2615021 RepID=UPI000B3C13A8|nr:MULTISPECIES: arsenate reductase (glutaredoxin) [unclassified Winogradskyella]ARV08467.1 arsenate reductase (glutaredoxin) [Winogradskyella sp. PC-19]
MIQILHNPRCRKSREGLALLETETKDFEIIKYLDDKLTQKELTSIITKLDISPIDLVRKNEAIWKDDYKGKDLSDNEIIEAMVQNPKLIERPIVINNNKAVVGRPTEAIKTIL